MVGEDRLFVFSIESTTCLSNKIYLSTDLSPPLSHMACYDIPFYIIINIFWDQIKGHVLDL